MNIDVDSVIKSFKEEFDKIFLGKVNIIDKVFQSVKNSIKKYISIDDFKRKFSLNFLKEITIMLKNEEINHNDFFLDNMRGNAIWQTLIKLILAKRIEELKKCKVLKKGKKFDISGLKKTYLGNIIANKLGYTRRSALSNQEYEKIITTIKKLKYEVPVTVQPTETEKFFAEIKNK